MHTVMCRRRADYSQFRHPLPSSNESPPITVTDKDGTTLYETELGDLLDKIVVHNDVAALQQYLAKAPLVPCQNDPEDGLPGPLDVFWRAAQYGSVDALRMLMEHYTANANTEQDILQSLAKCECLPLNAACEAAQLEAVQLLLDERAYVDIHARDSRRDTAIGAAAGLGFYGDIEPELQRKVYRQGEKVIRLLLDRGARASDVVLLSRDSPYETSDVPCDTVLTLAARWASAGLMRRLIDEGADVHAKTHHHYRFLHEEGDDEYRGVTALFTASLYGNVDAVKVLLDRGTGTEAVEVSHGDSKGGLPLHWAVRCQFDAEMRQMESSMLQERVDRIIATIQVLLERDATTINAQDHGGNTALHHAARYYGQTGKEHTAVLKLLCDRGADASLRNKRGETPLHMLCRPIEDGFPIERDAMALLLDRGARATDGDLLGSTPLHHVAGNLCQVDAARYLLDRGADACARNEKKNTPMHEAALGFLWPDVDDGLGVSSPKERMQAQDEMMGVLERGGGGEVMDVVNGEGKTPRVMREERRRLWRDGCG